MAAASPSWVGSMSKPAGESREWGERTLADLSSLLENMGKGKGFVFKRDPGAAPRVQESSGSWNQGDMRVAWLDFDNDGLLDLVHRRLVARAVHLEGGLCAVEFGLRHQLAADQFLGPLVGFGI